MRRTRVNEANAVERLEVVRIARMVRGSTTVSRVRGASRVRGVSN
jgi:hypothetical protein